MANLDALFKPRSIAIVGVSEEPSKLGSVLLSNLQEAKYPGKIYPINPKHETLYGFKVYKKVSEIPGSVDLVCIAVPAQFVKDVMLDCAVKKVKAAVIITAGFREVGEEGSKMEQEILAIAKKSGIRVLGPNCLGLIVPGASLNASFAASTPDEGEVAFISQSGAFCTAILDLSLENNMGFSHFVSLGNKLDIDENELIQNFFDSPGVRVIGAYLEEINYGQRLVEMVAGDKYSKPVIVFKPGITQEAKKAISSHTGSLAGSVETFETAMVQAGIVAAREINQMFYLMMGFAWAPLPKGNRVAVVTNAGGPGIIATDEIIQSGLEMAKISDQTREELKKFLPPTASLQNPIDVIGDALAERYRVPIEILIKDENVDSIMVILTPQLVTQIEDTAKLIINSAKLSPKPIFAVFIGGKYAQNGLQRLYDKKVPAFRYISDAVKVMSEMAKYYKRQHGKNKDQLINKQKLLKLAAKGKYQKELQKLMTKEVLALPEDLVAKIAVEVGLDLPKQIVTDSIQQAKNFAKGLFPVVLKATTDAIVHKTDVKALYLNIMSEQELESAFMELSETIKKQTGKSRVEVLVQEQIKAKEEMFIGVNRDGDGNLYDKNSRGFGHLLAFGKGGIYTEVYKDIAYALVPASENEVRLALETTHVDEILQGARGQKPLAFNKVIQAILAVQKLVVLYPQIISMDINPILVTEERAVAVDLKIFVG